MGENRRVALHICKLSRHFSCAPAQFMSIAASGIAWLFFCSHKRNLHPPKQQRFPSLNYLHRQTCLLLRHLKLERLPEPVLPLLLRRFFLELRFSTVAAKKLMKYAVRLHSHLVKNHLVEADWISFRMNFPYTTAVMALVVLVLKLCYGLNDKQHRRDAAFLESCTSPAMKKTFEVLPTFAEWAALVREDALLPCQMPYFAR